MDSTLVIVKDNDVFTTTLIMSKGFEVEHRVILRLFKKFKSDFESIGVIASFVQKPTTPKGGRPTEEICLNEHQAMYMGTLVANNERCRKFKMQLTSQFIKQRSLLMKLLTQKQNAEWLEKRASGKIERRMCTDTIKKFVEYCKEQGSENAEKYYMIISKMENNTLFHLDYIELEIPNIRDAVSGFALDSLKMADHAVARAIDEGMEKKMDYKDIYKLAKTRVEGFSSIIGKTPLSVAICDNSQRRMK